MKSRKELIVHRIERVITKKLEEGRVQKLAIHLIPRINQTDLAEQVNLSKPALSRILAGYRHKSAWNLLRLSTALNISLEDLILILEIRRRINDNDEKERKETSTRRKRTTFI